MGCPYLKCALHTKPEPIHSGDLQRAVQSKGEQGWWGGLGVANDALNMRLLLCKVDTLQSVASGVLTKETVALILSASTWRLLRFILRIHHSPLLLTNQEGLVLRHLISSNFCLLASNILNLADPL